MTTKDRGRAAAGAARGRTTCPAGRGPAALGAALVLLTVLLLATSGCDRGSRTAAPTPASTPAAAVVPTPAAAGAPGFPPPGRARDVVLVTIDTLRADATGFGGNADGTTPHLDRLAAGGRRFPRAHAHAVLTLPSHTSILTGLYPFEHGVRDNNGYRLAARVPTLATRLADAGFATGAFVAAFPLDARWGLDHGFAVYDDHYPDTAESEIFRLAERPGDQVVAAALAWWRENAGRRRFLWVHLFEPHAPYKPPAPFAARFPDRPYLGEVAAADAFLAPLLDPFLAEPAQAPLVVVTGDHGESLGEHGELTHGLFAYESTLHVPLVVWGPGIAPGSDPRLARHVDVVPTVLDALGLPAAEGLPGSSLLRPPPAAVDSYFEALHAALDLGWAPLRGTLAGDDKYIELPLPELYDLAADPGEEHNVLAAGRDLARRLDRSLPAEAPWPPNKGAVSDEEAKKLAALGYLSGAAGAKTVYTAADDPKNLILLDAEMQRMHQLYEARRLDEAEAVVRSVLAERPSMPAAWSFLAQVLLERDRYGAAVATMEEARRRGFASESLLRQLGLALAWGGHAGEAVELLRPLADAGGDPASLNALGTALVEAGRPREAVEVLRRVFARDPDDARAHENLSVALLALGEWRQAGAEARRALATDPTRPHSWNNLGVALYQEGDGPGALAAWERSLDLDPHQYDTLFNVGLKAAELGQAPRARDALERFVREAPAVRYGPDLDTARALLARLGGRS